MVFVSILIIEIVSFSFMKIQVLKNQFEATEMHAIYFVYEIKGFI